MATPLPTVLETTTAQKGGGGVVKPDPDGKALAVDLYSCSGLTPAYTRSRVARLGAVSESGASWAHHFFGGCGPLVVEVEGGAPDLDTAVKDQWEVELLRGTAVWHRGRLVNYKHREDEDTGRIYTTLFVEGYITRLRTILVTATYTSGTVADAVTDILDTYVTPSTRVDYAAADIQGGYEVNSLSFNRVPLLDAMNALAMLQGDVEWGVSEGDPKPKFYFLTESTTANENMQAISGQRASLETEGDFDEAYNTVKVLGGWGSTIVTGTATDATALAAYGAIEKTIVNSAIKHATDANRYATNWLALYKDGTGRYRGVIQAPPRRLERDRTGGTPFVATGYASFRGVDGVMARMPMSSVEYQYKPGSPFSLVAIVHGGLPEGCVQQQMSALSNRVASLENLVQQYDPASALPTTYSGTALVNPFVGNVSATAPTTEVHKTYTLTATADRTIDMAGAIPHGNLGQIITFQIQSDAAVARVITFGAYLKANGTLTTPATAGLVVAVHFASDGSADWIESGRQTAGL